MRLVTCERDGVERVGVRLGAGIVETDYEAMLDVIADGEGGLERIRDAVTSAELRGEIRTDATLLAPLPKPGKLLFCGRNYRDHVDENPNAQAADHPYMFSKLPSSIVGPDAPILIPRPDLQVDYEVELVMVIGKKAWRVPQTRALECVFGYTVVNDVSARAIQFKNHQVTLGKGLDTFCPMGPEIVLADEIPNPDNLTVSARVNGELRQHANTADMLFTPAALIEYLTTYITLEPGDVVSTGTPGGVGCFRDPPLYLKPGDVVEVEVDRIGTLSNTVEAAWQ